MVFVDLVNAGSTFGNLFRLLDEWAAAEGVPWRAMRPKLRFIGITHREKTSPNAFRWQQQAEWTSQLPASAVLNVSLPAPVWSYFGNLQPKMTASFTRRRWADAAIASPRRDPAAREALAEAVAIVERGRCTQIRQKLACAIAAEPTMAEPWLRELVKQIRSH